jgi:hypothetical protein
VFPLFFFLIEVTDSGFLVNPPKTVGGTGCVKDGLGERGFPRPSVPEKYYVANVVCIDHFLLPPKSLQSSFDFI